MAYVQLGKESIGNIVRQVYENIHLKNG